MDVTFERCSLRSYVRIRLWRSVAMTSLYLMGAVLLTVRGLNRGIGDGMTFGLVMTPTVPVVIYLYLRISMAARGELARFVWDADRMLRFASPSHAPTVNRPRVGPAVVALKETLRGPELVGPNGRFIRLDPGVSCTALVFWRSTVVGLRFTSEGAVHEQWAIGWVPSRRRAA